MRLRHFQPKVNPFPSLCGNWCIAFHFVIFKQSAEYEALGYKMHNHITMGLKLHSKSIQTAISTYNEAAAAPSAKPGCSLEQSEH